MKKVSLNNLNEVFAAIAAKNDLYIPVDTEAGVAKFEKWAEGKELSKELNTVRSAKDFFFPQVEDMAEFKVDGKNIEIIDTRKEMPDFVMFGVRACDFRSFSILDKVYLVEPVDSYYKNRRDHATIVTLACNAPEETCFCQNFGIDASEPGGDVSAWIADGDMYFKANTEKGEALLAAIDTEDGDDKKVDEAKAEIKAIIEKLPISGLDMSRFKGENLLELFDDPRWQELSEACLACGTCTYVCPTCQCYDIREFDTGHGVKRFRCWDSCMYADFTKEAAGNPRSKQVQRFRQRFMHKLVYFPENNEGEYGCVGCGRCVKKCPIHMNIVKVIKALGVEK